MKPRAACIALVLGLSWAAAGANADSPSTIKWVRRLDEGLRLAGEQQKDVLINFTGHGWCYYCELLDTHVFGQPAFAAAEKDFVLVELDYPSADDFPDSAVKNLYQSWKTQYLIHGFPTVMLTDRLGTPYAYTGYDDGITAASFLKELASHRARRQVRDEHLTAARNTGGEARARELHAAIQVVAPWLGTLEDREDDPVLVFYAKVIDEIRQLDADNAAGLLTIYDRLRSARDAYHGREAIFQELDRFRTKESYPDAIAYIDGVLPTASDPAMRWRLQWARQVYLERDHQYAAALDYVRQLMTDPKQTFEHLDQLLDREDFNLFNLGRIDEAVANCDRRISNATDDPAKRLKLVHHKASMLTAHAKGAPAIAACREFRAATTFPSEDWQVATLLWAVALQKDSQHREAIERWEDLMKAQGVSTRLLLPIARNQQALGLIDEARKSLEQADEVAKTEFQNAERHQDKEALKRFQDQSEELRKLLGSG